MNLPSPARLPRIFAAALALLALVALHVRDATLAE
jgi:energy-converting hydrogenase Eha subunit F